MKRLAALVLVLFASPAAAQPRSAPKPDPKTSPAPAEAPIDPYADAPVALPATKATKAQAAKAKGTARPKGQPAAKPGPAESGKPVDPYAAPAPADPYGDAPDGTDAGAKPASLSATSATPATPAAAPPAAPQPQAKRPPEPAGKDDVPKVLSRVGIADVTAVQGLLAVQRLDGWLLFDRAGANPIAKRLVAPEGDPTRPWFYIIPAKGEPLALVHDAEKRSFDHLPGSKLTYQGYRDLDKQLRAMLKGVRAVALEYSPKAAVPNISRVDAGTLELIRAAGVQVKSSETLVQFTKAIWGDAGRTAHYVAAHHLVELRKEALAFVAKQLRAGAPVTEYDVQQRLVRGMAMRGLASAAPVVAAGVNTADPYYVPNAAKAARIQRGDLIVISLAAKLDKLEGVYAAQTWCAVADATVRDEVKRAFETASLARDQALALIADRLRKHRPITGAEVDQSTRAFIKKAGLADKVKHRTGHSIDNDLQGGGADLDDFEVRDTRSLTPGTGVTVGPGLYFAGQFGVRTEVSVYLSPGGPEITTPAQDDVEALLAR